MKAPSRRAALLLLSVLLLAGCLGGDGGRGPPSEPSASPTGSSGPSSSATTTTTQAPPPRPLVLDLLLAFEFTGCHGITLQASRSLEDVQALLPEGFTATVPPDSPPGTAGVLAVDLFACGNLTTPSVGLADPVIGLLYTYIQRPSDRVPGAPDAPVQEYVFRLLANASQPTAALWPAAGYDTYSGATTVDTVVDSDLVRLATARVGDGYFLVAPGADTALLGNARNQAFARYTALSDGSVLLWTGTYDLPVAAAGPGYLEVPQGDPFERYATPARPALAGVAVLTDAGAVHAQDLRRVFT